MNNISPYLKELLSRDYAFREGEEDDGDDMDMEEDMDIQTKDTEAMNEIRQIFASIAKRETLTQKLKELLVPLGPLSDGARICQICKLFELGEAIETLK